MLHILWTTRSSAIGSGGRLLFGVLSGKPVVFDAARRGQDDRLEAYSTMIFGASRDVPKGCSKAPCQATIVFSPGTTVTGLRKTSEIY
jgi:hypothetical protein